MKYSTGWVDTNGNRAVMHDWGFDFLVNTEIEALRIAYVYRDNPHGVKIETLAEGTYWLVLVFNEFAAEIKLDGAK